MCGSLRFAWTCFIVMFVDTQRNRHEHDRVILWCGALWDERTQPLRITEHDVVSANQTVSCLIQLNVNQFVQRLACKWKGSEPGPYPRKASTSNVMYCMFCLRAHSLALRTTPVTIQWVFIVTRYFFYNHTKAYLRRPPPVSARMSFALHCWTQCSYAINKHALCEMLCVNINVWYMCTIKCLVALLLFLLYAHFMSHERHPKQFGHLLLLLAVFP